MRSAVTPTRERPLGRSRSLAGLALASLAPTLTAGLTLGVGLATAPAANAAPAKCTTAGLVTTCTFGFFAPFGTGAAQDWVVPAGVDRATFTVIGAAGAAAYGDSPGGAEGGRGRGTIATMSTTPGQVLKLYVGGTSSSSSGGWNGGGDGGAVETGGGGGASDVRVAPYELADRILVGGGGGGGGGPAMKSAGDGIAGGGGNGGGAHVAGAQGTNVSGGLVGAGGGWGGTAVGGGGGGGAAGWDPHSFGDFCNVTHAGSAGSSGQGGAGGYLSNGICDLSGGGGGGGGGGWYGGGGGGGGTTGGAGGGGGSGYGPAGSTSTPPGALGAHGKITISYRDPATGWVGLSGGGQLSSAPTAVFRPSQPEPTQDVFYLDTNSQVIQRVVTEGVPGPEHNLGAVLYPGSTVAAAWSAGGSRLDLFGRGTESALWQKTFTWTQGWGPWTARTTPDTLTSSPTAVSLSLSRLDVFFRGTDNRLKRLASTNGTWAQTPTTVSGMGALSTAPTAAVTNPQTGRVEVYAGCNGNVLCGWTYDSYGTGDTWTVNSSSLTTAPVAASSSPGQVQVTVRDHNDHLIVWQNRYGAWKQTDLGTPPAAAGTTVAQASIAQAPMSGASTILYARGPLGLTARTIAP